MNSVVITGYGIVLHKLLTPEKLFNLLAAGETLLCEDELLKSMGIAQIPGVTLNRAERKIIFDKLHHNAVSLRDNSIVQAMAMSSIIDTMKMSQLSRSTLPAINHELFFANNKIFPSLNTLYLSAGEADSGEIDIEDRCHIPLATEIFSDIAEYLNSSSPLRIYSDACTAGMSALNSAFLSIRHGHIDVAVVCAPEEATHPMKLLLNKRKS